MFKTKLIQIVVIVECYIQWYVSYIHVVTCQLSSFQIKNCCRVPNAMDS